MSIGDFLEKHNKSLRRWWLLYKWMLLAFIPASIEVESVSSINGAKFWAWVAIFMIINMIFIALGYAMFTWHFKHDKEEEERKRGSKM